MDLVQETITLLELRLQSIRRQVGPLRRYRAGRNCQKGYNCGGSCITRRKNCRKALKGEAKNFSDWMVQKMSANIGAAVGDAPADVKRTPDGKPTSDINAYDMRAKGFDARKDKIVRKEDGGTYAVSSSGAFPDTLIEHDGVDARFKGGVRQSTDKWLKLAKRENAKDPYMSKEGAAERAAYIDEELKRRDDARKAAQQSVRDNPPPFLTVEPPPASPKAKAKPKAEPKTKAKSEPKAKTEPKPKAEPKAKSKPKSEPKAKTKADADAKAKAKAELTSEPIQSAADLASVLESWKSQSVDGVDKGLKRESDDLISMFDDVVRDWSVQPLTQGDSIDVVRSKTGEPEAITFTSKLADGGTEILFLATAPKNLKGSQNKNKTKGAGTQAVKDVINKTSGDVTLTAEGSSHLFYKKMGFEEEWSSGGGDFRGMRYKKDKQEFAAKGNESMKDRVRVYYEEKYGTKIKPKK